MSSFLHVGFGKPSLVLAVLLLLGSPAGAEETASGDAIASVEAAPEVEAPAATGEGKSDSPKRTLKVMTKPFTPFAFLDAEGEWVGFSIDLWSRIAERLGVQHEMSGTSSLQVLLESVEATNVDVGVAGITITAERESKLDFTHPFFESGLQIMVNTEGGGEDTWGVISAFLSAKFFMVMAGFIVVLLFCGHLIWLTERKREDSDFSPEYLAGVWDGFWWAAVTVTTVGYGDKAPKGGMGRVVGLLWMFISLFLISYFTASVTTALTVEKLGGGIVGPADLPGKRVGAPAGTTAAKFITRAGARVSSCENIEACYDMLREKRVDAIVFDAPVLQYHAATEGAGMLTTVGPLFQRESYGFALPSGSPLREQINNVLLDVREDGTYQELSRKWFGTE